jgi:hypothetical protein
VGCKRQGVIISELSLLQGRKRFLGVVVRDFVRDRKLLEMRWAVIWNRMLLDNRSRNVIRDWKRRLLESRTVIFSDFQGFV